jgi:succinate dehydrogenase / fumarate reductase cytochrome b subunit
MADVNRDARPLSPHLQVYRVQWTMLFSIAHRITGVGLTVGAVLVVWWLLAAATSPDYFATVDGLMTSWIGVLILVLSAFALWYHACAGVKHLIWDAGYMLETPRARLLSQGMAAASVVLTLLTLLLV